MDALSRLIQLTRLQGSLDLRCRMAGSFAVDHPAAPAGEAPFHLVLSGRCMLDLDGGESRLLTSGDFVLLPRGRAHLVRDADVGSPGRELRIDRSGLLPLRSNTDGEGDLDLLCGRFQYAPGSAGLLMSALPEALHVSLTGNASLDSIRALIALLRSEVQQQHPGALAVVTSLSHAVLVMAMREYMQGRNTPPGLLTVLIEPRLGRAVQAMLSEPGRTWTVQSLAERAAMSRATFARRFQSCAGMSPWTLLTQLRMHMAADMLQHGNSAVAVVAQRVGYESEAAFGKAFRRHAGISPAHYRRQHHSKSAGTTVK
jgi:AraC family transcriptional activator of mtrCDE